MKNCDFIPENPNSAFSGNFSSGLGKSTTFVHYTRDFPPVFGSNVLGSTEKDQLKGLGGRNDFHWRRKVGAVKSKLGNGIKCDRLILKKNPMKVKLFRERCEEISRNAKEGVRVDLKAMNELTKEGKISKECPSIVGPVLGVEVGDRFRYRVELRLVGLHRHYERGIDWMELGRKRIATCIVANEGYLDIMSDPNVLTYIGEGGKARPKELDEKPNDQELKGGNLALWESMMLKSPVRVVKGFKVVRRLRGRLVHRFEYVYDGLYEVNSVEKKKGLLQNLVFEFKLLRCHGQPSVSCRRMRNLV